MQKNLHPFLLYMLMDFLPKALSIRLAHQFVNLEL